LGRKIDKDEYTLARRQMATCSNEECANKTKVQQMGFCPPCRKAHKLSREFETKYQQL